MAQREQIDARLQLQLRRDGGERGELDQRVAAVAVERHVVAEEDAVDARDFGVARVLGDGVV